MVKIEMKSCPCNRYSPRQHANVQRQYIEDAAKKVFVLFDNSIGIAHHDAESRSTDGRRLLLGVYRFLANCNSNRVMAYGHR